SFAPGGYFQTPLEEALPVEMRIRDQQRLPQVTIVYVIDRSGSMGAVGPSGVDNLELAKEAIIRSIDFLQPTDRAGVISFDSSGYWVANIQPILDRFGLQRLVASLRTGGGTDILAGMTLAARDIVSEPSERKHIILLTDGGADPNGLVKLTEDLLNDHDVTTSVIAIGAGAATFLQDMATGGGGYYHPVDVVENIPTIFTVETVLATRSYILEDAFVPTITANSPIMEGITSAPTLLGYVASSPRQTAQVILRGPGPYNDPLLASWQYGLGRSVAFTSDATARWGANWVSWSDFSRFWSQTVRWTITEGTSENLEPRIVMEGERARLVVDARDGDGAFLNGLTLQASMVDPSLEAELVPLQQTAPGRYEAVFAPDVEGAYFVRLTGNGVMDGENIEVGQTTGWVMSYSPEYDIRNAGADEDLLADLAALTGGRSLADDPGAAFAHTLGAQPAATNVWPWLLLVAVALLPFDIAVRRLVVTRRDLQHAREAIFGAASDAVQAPSERLSTLMAAKGRAQERTAEQAVDSPASTVGALRARRDEARTSRENPAAPAPSSSGERPRFTPEGGAGGTQAPPTPASTAGALLSSKRKRGKEE
ncbi:MAG: VWA domain-containing protein, partial [Burkholderiales bacterium]|nr:VWA domain-containing protein [Anaerolineae bacterium]